MDSPFVTRIKAESTLDRRVRDLYESRGMKTPAFLLKLLFVLAVAIPAKAAEPVGKPTVVLISGEFEYESSKRLTAFKKFLEGNHQFNCIYLEREKGENIPGL